MQTGSLPVFTSTRCLPQINAAVLVFHFRALLCFSWMGVMFAESGGPISRVCLSLFYITTEENTT